MKKKNVSNRLKFLMTAALLTFHLSASAEEPSTCEFSRNGVSVSVHYYGGCGERTSWIATATSDSTGTIHAGGEDVGLESQFPSCCPV
jgi:hypothetical protein